MLPRRRRRLPAPEIVEQIKQAGYLPYLMSYTMGATWLNGFVALPVLPALLAKLRDDDRFVEGALFGLHRDIGNALTDFRSHTGELGKGSLQFVIDKETGRLYADVDKFSPYSDIVGIVGHTGEVIGSFFKRIFR